MVHFMPFLSSIKEALKRVSIRLPRSRYVIHSTENLRAGRALGRCGRRWRRSGRATDGSVLRGAQELPPYQVPVRQRARHEHAMRILGQASIPRLGKAEAPLAAGRSRSIPAGFQGPAQRRPSRVGLPPPASGRCWRRRCSGSCSGSRSPAPFTSSGRGRASDCAKQTALTIAAERANERHR